MHTLTTGREVALNTASAPTSLELFAGGGGMALGFGRAGFSHEALVEWWAPAVSVLKHNASLQSDLWAAEAVHEADVRRFVTEWDCTRDITLVAGGPPCQPFSLAGEGAGHSDARNMFPAAIDVVRAVQPQFVVFENVPGLLRPSFAPYLDYVREQLQRPHIKPKKDELWDEHFRRVAASRSQAQYSVHQIHINAADLGVPQSRKRIFLIAIRRDVDSGTTWRPPSRTHSEERLLHDQWIDGSYWERHGLARPDMPQRIAARVQRLRDSNAEPAEAPWVTLRDVLSNIPEPTTESPEGWPNHYSIPGARVYPNHTGSAADSPSKTIKAGVHGVAGGEAMVRELDGNVRYLSIREAAIVQGFPRTYEFPGPRSRMMGVIGNAVAVDVAAAIGTSLMNLRLNR